MDASMIGNIVVAACTLIGFIATFVKIGGRFVKLETDVNNLKLEAEKKSLKLDNILCSVNEMRIQIAVMNENLKHHTKEDIDTKK